MVCCDICNAFDEQNTLLKEYSHWKLLLRNRNTTLGNCVAITKRHLEKFSDITSEEMKEFASVVKDLESALQKAFQYDKMNYQMLMMKDKHTHFHVLPRYSSVRHFVGIDWTDEDWPKATLKQKESIPSDVLQKVREEIKKNI